MSHLFGFRFELGRKFLLLTLIFLAVLATSCGGSGNDSIPTPDDPVVAHGFGIFKDHCASCHSLKPDTIIVGPSFVGLATRASTRVDGLSDREYLRLSIMKPDIYIVDGFKNLMPVNVAARFSDEEVDALISYLLTLE
jgi:cytochrome c551/c552